MGGVRSAAGNTAGGFEFCWLNGDIVSCRQARIDPADRGFLLADGLFETLLLRRGAAVWWREHLARLRHGAEVLGIGVPWTDAQLAKALAELAAANHLHRISESALRITLSRGIGARGLAPPETSEATLLLRAAPLAQRQSALRGIVATSVRRNEAGISARLKTLNYTDAVIALREALAAGAEEALLPNTAGRLACATSANLFVWRGGELLTPPTTEGCLPGITRAHVLATARRLGMPCREAEIAALEAGDGVFLSNSLIGLLRLSQVDGIALGDCGELEALAQALRRRMD